MGHSPYLCEFDFTYSSGSRLICLWEVDYSLILLVLVGERALNDFYETVFALQGSEQPLNDRYEIILAVQGVEQPLNHRYAAILTVQGVEQPLNDRYETILAVQGVEQPLNHRYGTILAVKGVEHPLTPSTSKNPNPSLSSLTKKSLLVLIIRLDERKLLFKCY